MSFLHERSHEVTKSELNLFSIDPTQTAIDGGMYIYYHPISSISNSNTVDFHISGSGDEYLDLSNSRLFVQLCIENANGESLADTSKCAPVNNLMSSLFSKCQVYFND